MYNSPYSSSIYSGGYGSGMSNYGYGGYSSYSSMRPGYTNNLQNPQNPQQQQNPPPPNERKQLFQEYFKMMGGARSVLQMGFGGIFLVSTAKQTYSLLKKIIMFLISTSKKFANFFMNHIPLTNQAAALYKKLLMQSPNSQNSKTSTNRIMLALRIISFFFLLLCIKVKMNLKRQVEEEQKKIQEETKLIQQQRLQEQMYDNYHQKEGYF